MRQYLCVIFVSLLSLYLPGCGPAVSEEELGRIVYEVPAIPEGYQPYQLPDLTESSESEASEPVGDETR